MGEIKNTILLTGVPRSGTTLCCHILNSYNNVLALHEPLVPAEFVNDAPATIIEKIKHFSLDVRKQVIESRVAPSQQRNGMVPDNPISTDVQESGLRGLQVELGYIQVGEHIRGTDFTLVIKQNAFFTALLDNNALNSEFDIYAVIRNPLAVLASWGTVNLPVNKGHVPAGEMLSCQLRKELAGLSDVLDRQIAILHWFFAQYRTYLAAGKILRYENLVKDPMLLSQVMGLNASYSSELVARQSRNHGYAVNLQPIAERLMASKGAIWDYYSHQDVEALLK